MGFWEFMAKRAERRGQVLDRAQQAPQPASHSSNNLRPLTFDDYVGQDNAKQLLKMTIYACKERREMPGHILLSGNPGTGKTTIANIIANEFGGKLLTTSATAFRTDVDLAHVFEKAVSEGYGFIFLDECHNIPRRAMEMAYSALEDFSFEYIDRGKGLKQVKMPRICVIGATTEVGTLSKPLRDRFQLNVRLEAYTEQDMKAIIARGASRLSVGITEPATAALAQRSRLTPRIATQYLKSARDYALAMRHSHIVDTIDVVSACNLLGLDDNGLTTSDIAVLQALSDSTRPVGLKTLSSLTAVDEQTISEVAEPYLLQLGLITKGAKGRSITDAGRTYILGR